ncbi:MAG: N-acetylmuramoyl-L-alanine amidase [Chitinophagaceae bacterium]|nr:N-acetylmuramoyl-L-alanine amidase [Chitinophagaceae bacterium]
MKNIFLLFSFVSLIVFACSPSKYAETNKSYKKQVKDFSKLLREYPLRDSAGLNYAPQFVGTINMSLRRPNYVIIHHTAQHSTDETLKTFTIKNREVSAHYVIGRDGVVYHMLNDLMRAHHAGVSRWGNNTDLNSSSIGIELDNDGFEPFSEAQINSLTILLDRLKKAYSIPSANFIGHGDIAPTRKNDPNWRFPWKQLSEKGFGLWYNDTTSVQVPAGFDHLNAIRIIGYDLKDTSAAIIAFKRHFLQDTTKRMTPGAEKVLYSLFTKYR